MIKNVDKIDIAFATLQEGRKVMSTYQIVTTRPIKATLTKISKSIKKLKPDKIELLFEELPVLKIYVNKNNAPIIFMFDSYCVKHRKEGILSFNWFGQKPVFSCHGMFEPTSLYEYIVFLEILHLFANEGIIKVGDKYWKGDKKYTNEDYKSIYRELKTKKINKLLKLIECKQLMIYKNI